MKKLKIIAVALACATILAGCGGGNPHEKMVTDFLQILQSNDHKKIDEFAATNFDPSLKEMLENRIPEYNEFMGFSAKSLKKKFSAISSSKAPIKTRGLKMIEDPEGKCSVVEGVCNGVTLYFFVGGEAGKENRILLILDDEDNMEKIFGQMKIEMEGSKKKES